MIAHSDLQLQVYNLYTGRPRSGGTGGGQKWSISKFHIHVRFLANHLATTFLYVELIMILYKRALFFVFCSFNEVTHRHHFLHTWTMLTLRSVIYTVNNTH